MAHPTADGDGFYLLDKRSYIPTILTQGPWDPVAQHGGPVAGLLATIVEATPSLVPMQVVRLTVDLLRPVPLEPLDFERQVVREGRRVQAVDAQLVSGNHLVARATALRMRVGEDVGPSTPTPASDLPGPAMAVGLTHESAYVPGILRAVELRVVPQDLVGSRSILWLRVGVPIVIGHPEGPLAALAVAADFTSLAGLPGLERSHSAINGDLNLHVLRPPTGEWIALEGRTTLSSSGIGQSTSVLSDTDGPLAVASCAQVVGVRR